MCDLRLKPKILRNLLSEYVPNEKQPLSNFLSLSKVVSTISTHKLLSESPPASIDQKLHANSKSAVDDWVASLVALVSSDMPDKSWVGICLHVKNAAQIVSLSHTLVGLTVYYHILRLSRFSNTKKDAVSHASKVILPG